MIKVLIGLILLVIIGSIWIYMKIIDFECMKGEKEMNKKTCEKLWNMLSEEQKDEFREVYLRQKKEREESLNKILKGRLIEEFDNFAIKHIINEEQEEKGMREKLTTECNHRTEDGFQDTIVKDPDTGEYKCSQCGYVFPSEDKDETDMKNSSFFKLMIVYSEYNKKRFHEFYEIPSDDFLEAKSKADKIIKDIPSTAIIEKVVLCRCDMEF